MDKPIPARLGFGPIMADKLTLALLQPELFAALNIPLRARHGELRVVYREHMPELWVRTPHAGPCCIAKLNTRTRRITAYPPSSPDLAAMCADIERRLQTLGAALTMTYKPDQHGRKRVKLQIRHRQAERIVMTLREVAKHHASPWMGSFKVDDGAEVPEAEVAHG